VTRTKLVCTIGPATASRVDELVAAGMDVARINFSHGAASEHAAAAASVQRAAEAAGRPVAILVDLAGPKMRLGDLAGGSAHLEADGSFVLRAPADGAAGDAADTAPGDASGASVSYARLGADVRVGDPIFLADGAAQLRVTSVGEDVRTEVVRGGTIRSRAGVAIPAARLSAPALTEEDLADIPRTIELGAAYVGQSFVRGSDDILELRRLLGPDGPMIVAKIETRPAVDAFDDILGVADAVMIARGDLGVELPYEEVPLLQKQLLRRALDRGVPTIVATQMLESMTVSPRPTRAEASDVANAVFDGADAIMLSGETAIGAHPVLAAEAAVRIAAHCEAAGQEYLPAGMRLPPNTDAGSLAYAAVALAATQPAVAAIGCYTRTGRTARILASLRPTVPIIAFSPDQMVTERLALIHGIVARRCAPIDEPKRLPELRALIGDGALVPDGAMVVVVSSTATPGSAPNLLGLDRVPASSAHPTA
jgi:pyruvate kinase